MVSRNLKLTVKNKAEFEAIKRAMEMPDVRAFVTICGHLEPLSQRARERVMRFVIDETNERAGA